MLAVVLAAGVLVPVFADVHQAGPQAAGAASTPATYQSLVIKDRPVVYYPMEDTELTSVVDASGNGLHGSVFGGPGRGVAGAVGRGTKINSGSGVRTPESPRLNLGPLPGHNSNGFSIELWLRSDSEDPGRYADVISRGSGCPTNGYSHIIQFDENRELVGLVSDGSTTYRGSFGGYDGSDQNWHHVAMVGASGTVAGVPKTNISLYFDGVKTASFGALSQSLEFPFTREFSIGTDDCVTESGITVDEVAIYDRALAAGRVKKHYTTGAPTSTTSSLQITGVSEVRGKGWIVTWSEHPGAARYQVSRALTRGSWVKTINPNTRSVLVPGTSAHQLDTGSTEEQFTVSALNNVGQPIATAHWTDRCAPVFFVGARGSGQNSPPSKYALGLGPEGRAVLIDVRKRLLIGNESIRSVPIVPPWYPAVGVFTAFNPFTSPDYNPSVEGGVIRTIQILDQLGQECPASLVVLFGFSQGAQAIGNAYREVFAAGGARNVARVVLMGDPRYRSGDPAVTFMPRMQVRDGVLGQRAAFSSSVPTGTIESWCWSADLVCQRGSVRPHGPPYHCYGDHIGYRIAQRIASAFSRAPSSITPESCGVKL